MGDLLSLNLKIWKTLSENIYKPFEVYQRLRWNFVNGSLIDQLGIRLEDINVFASNQRSEVVFSTLGCVQIIQTNLVQLAETHSK